MGSRGDHESEDQRINPNLHYELTYKSVNYPSQASF